VKRTFRIGERNPALDIVSYGRRGVAGRPLHFTRDQIAQIARTVRSAPEVMVKVSGGSNTTKGVAAHFQYIGRRGELEIETDDGERLMGKEVAAQLVDDWDLDLDALRDDWDTMERGGRRNPKLVHNIILSMPSKTPPDRLLAASREFAREEFALKHRYAMVLHTDQAHPHVHLVVSAHKSDGGRLNIQKADLRRWREQSAYHLRNHGRKPTPRPRRSAVGCRNIRRMASTGPRSDANHEWSGSGRGGHLRPPGSARRNRCLA
jgi:hypothetical protein